MSKEMPGRQRLVSYIYIAVLFFITLVGATYPFNRGYGHGDTSLLIEETTKRIESDPQNGELYAYRGYLYIILRDWNTALADLDTASTVSRGKLPVIPILRARAWLLGSKLSTNGALKRSRLTNALNHVNAFIEKNPEHADGAIVKSEVLAALGRHKEAASLHKELIEEFRLNPGPGYYIRQADWLVADKRPTEAVDFLDIGIKQLGSVVTLFDRAISLELAMGDYESALKRADILLTLPGRKERDLVRKADILLAAGRQSEAAELYNQALILIEMLPEKTRASGATNDLENHIQQKLK